MTPKQEAFVREYLVDLNATAAYKRAGYTAKGNSAEVNATRLLRNAQVAAAIEKAKVKRSDRTEITADMVLDRWWQIATADPNDLIQFRRTCCRHCHGEGHGFQWRDAEEFAEALLAAKQAEAEDLPTDKGGYGFDRKADPHPDCPKCDGEGKADIHGLDTRKLTGGARLLYAGAKLTRDGFEIKMQDQGKALEQVARHLGMYNDKINLTGAITVNIDGKTADL